MANLCITSVCNQRCEYCFARNGPVEDEVSFMPWDRFIAALDLLQRSAVMEARLLGGEPTLHPEFPRMVAEIVSRGMKPLVFTNGRAPEPALRAMEANRDSITALLNVNFSEDLSAPDVSSQQTFLRRLRDRVCLSVSIYTPRMQSLLPLVALIDTYGLARSVRLGLAHGQIGGSNHWLRPKQYHLAAPVICEFVVRARASGIHVSFDCGFVPCMFPDESMAMLREMGIQIRGTCEPVLDVLPTGQIVYCYPLAALYRESLAGATDRESLRRQFQIWFSEYRCATIFKKCMICLVRGTSECTGGCLAASLSRLRHREVAAVSGVNTSPLIPPPINLGAAANTVIGLEGVPNP